MKHIIKYKNIMYNDDVSDYYMIDECGNIDMNLGDNSQLSTPKFVKLPLKSDIQYTYVGLTVFKLDKKYSNEINYFRLDVLLCWFYKNDEVVRNSYIDCSGCRLFNVIHLNGDTLDNSLCNLGIELTIESWKILEYEDVMKNIYMISNCGHIMNIKTSRLLRMGLSKGYNRVSLTTVTGDHKSYKVHRLVLCNFNWNSQYKLLTVNHIDGNKTNNHITNLEWTNNAENNYHAWLLGLHQNYGESVSVFSDNVVERCCQLLLQNEGRVLITKNMLNNEGYEVSESFVRHIKFKHTRCDVSDKYFGHGAFPDIYRGEKSSHSKFKNTDIDRVCELLVKHNGNSNMALKDLEYEGYTGFDTWTVYAIKHKIIWKHISDKYFKFIDGRFIEN